MYGSFFDRPSAGAGSGLPLAVEVDSSHRRSKIVKLSKILAAEVLTPPRSTNILLYVLPEQHENESVNPHRWPRAFIAHNFFPCMHAKINYMCEYYICL